MLLNGCDNGLERELLQMLLNANYPVRPQFAAGGFRVELVVEGAWSIAAYANTGDIRWTHHPRDLDVWTTAEMIGPDDGFSGDPSSRRHSSCRTQPVVIKKARKKSAFPRPKDGADPPLCWMKIRSSRHHSLSSFHKRNSE